MAPSATYNTAWQAGAGEASGSGTFDLHQVLTSGTGDGVGENWEPHKRQHTLAGDRAYSNLKDSLLSPQGPAIFIAGSRGSGKTHLLMSLIGEVCREDTPQIVRIPVIISALKFRSKMLTWEDLSPGISDAVVVTMQQVEKIGRDHPTAFPQFKTIASLKRPLSQIIKTNIEKEGLEATIQSLGRLKPKISLILGFDDLDKLDDAKVKQFLIESQNNIQHILNTPSKLVFSVRPQTWTLLESESHEDTNFLIGKLQGSSQHIVVPTLQSMSADEIQKLINERIRYMRPTEGEHEPAVNGRGGAFDRTYPQYGTVEEAVKDLGCWPLHTLNDEGQIYDLRDWLVRTYTKPVIRDLLMALEFMLNNDSPPPKSHEKMNSLLEKGLSIANDALSRELIRRLFDNGYTQETWAREAPFFTGPGLERSIDNAEHLELLRNFFRGSDEAGDMLLRNSRIDKSNLTILDHLRIVMRTFDNIEGNESFVQWVLPSGHNYSGFAEDVIARMDKEFFNTFFSIIRDEVSPDSIQATDKSGTSQTVQDIKQFLTQSRMDAEIKFEIESAVPRSTPKSRRNSIAKHFVANAEPFELEAMEAAIQRGDQDEINRLNDKTRFWLKLIGENTNSNGSIGVTAMGTFYQKVASAAGLGRAVHWEKGARPKPQDLDKMRKILLQYFLSLVLKSPELIDRFNLGKCLEQLGWKLSSEIDHAIINSIGNLHREKDMTVGIMVNRTVEAANAMITQGMFSTKAGTNIAEQQLRKLLNAVKSNDALYDLYTGRESIHNQSYHRALERKLHAFTTAFCPYPAGPRSVPGSKWADSLQKMNTKVNWIELSNNEPGFARRPTFQLLLRIASAEMAGGSIHETLEDGSIVPLIRQSEIKIDIQSPTEKDLPELFEMLHQLHLEMQHQDRADHIGEINIRMNDRTKDYIDSIATWRQIGEPSFDEKSGQFIALGGYALKKEIAHGIVTIHIGNRALKIRDGINIEQTN